MLFNWKGAVIVLSVLAAVIALCAVDLRCSGGVGSDSSIARMKGEWAEGKKAIEIIEGIYTSSRTGKKVFLGEK